MSGDDPKNHYIYIIVIDGQDVCKVGISGNPKKRLRQLQTGSPFKMKLSGSLTIPHPSLARDIEAIFHKVCRPRHTAGEWFRMGPEEALLILAQIIYHGVRENLGLPHEDAVNAMEISGVPPAFIERATAVLQ